MDDVTPRLIGCFKTVFPDLSDSEIVKVSQSSHESWDSIATVTLANVVSEEFSIPIDFERLVEMDSFDSVREWVVSEAKAA